MIFLIPPIAAVLNRLRGDASWMPAWLSGRALWYVTPLMGLLSWSVVPWQIALAVAGTYLTWALTGWGRWFDLGRMPELTRPRSGLEDAIEHISFGSDHVALFWRHLMVLPGLAVLAWATGTWWLTALAPVMAAAFVACYELAWRIDPTEEPIKLAELMVGALWGAFIVLLWSIDASWH